MVSYLGHSIDELLRKLGPPLRESRLTDSGQVAQWDVGYSAVEMVPRSVSASVPRPPQAQPAALYEPFTPVIGDGWGGVILNPDPPGPRSELPFISGDPYTEGRLEAL